MYTQDAPVVSSAAGATAAKPVQAKQPPPQVVPNKENAAISGAPAPQIVSKEEKVEYRDQDGNLLDEEQVKSLKGKVEFKTKYETKTRVVDDNGIELPMPEGGWPAEYGVGVAPPHPDVEGMNRETVKKHDGAGGPAEAAASLDGEKEAENSRPKPASDGQGATGHEEL